MKRYLTLMLVCVMLLGTLSFGSAMAVSDPTFSVTDAQSEQGSEFSVDINISNNPGIIALGLQVEYDSSILELKEANSKDFTGTTFGPTSANPFTLTWDGSLDPNNTTNGAIAQLTFVVKDNATVGDTEITITYNPENVFNQDFENVYFQTVAGTVTVLCAEHQYGDLIPEVPAKCGTAGKKAYYECSVCGKLFDGNKTEVTEEQLVIPALTHVAEEGWHSDPDNHWKICTNDGCGEVIDGTTAAHDFQWVEDKPATEDEAGIQHEECSVCKYKRNENTEIPQLEHVHTGITYHEAVTANCHSTGTVEYWTCSSNKCAGKYYSDADCTTEITEISTPIDSDNHDGGTEIRNAVDATCDAAGYTGDTYCLGCGAKLSDGTEIPATGEHVNAEGDWVQDDSDHWLICDNCGTEFDKAAHQGGEATCSHKAICSVCNMEYGQLNPENHINTEIRGAIAATEESEGYTGDTWCIDCEQMIAEGSVVAKLDHTHEMVKTEAKAATHEEDGNIEYYTCSKCGKKYNDEMGTSELTDEEIILKATGHNYGDDWKTDEINHWHECDCGERADVESHNFGEWTVIQEPSSNTDGSRKRDCSVCGYTQTEEIPASGTEEPENPETGDDISIFLWIAILAVSSCSLIATLVTSKRSRERK